MATVQTPAATLDDLARVADKAELIDGRIELLMPTGRKPGRVAGRDLSEPGRLRHAAWRGRSLSRQCRIRSPPALLGPGIIRSRRIVPSRAVPRRSHEVPRRTPHAGRRGPERERLRPIRRGRARRQAGGLLRSRNEACLGRRSDRGMRPYLSGRVRPINRPPSAAVKSSRPNPCSPAGASMWIGSLPDIPAGADTNAGSGIGPCDLLGSASSSFSSSS